MIIQDDLKDLLQFLNDESVEFVIVGGYAVAFHGFVRATKDIDILFRNSTDNINAIVNALERFGISKDMYDHSLFQEEGRIIRLGSPPSMAELINGIDGVEFEEVWSHRIKGTYGDVDISFISKDDLYKTKLASGRPQDIRDLKELGFGDSDKGDIEID